MADIAPRTISNLGLLSDILSKMPASFSFSSTPNDLPTPGGPDTIIALTVPSIVASVIVSRISKRSLIRSIAFSSVSPGAFKLLADTDFSNSDSFTNS